MKNKLKAIALLSGGLDSQLAAKLIQEQGITVIGLHFVHIFNSPLTKEKDHTLSAAAKELGISLKAVNIDKDIIKIVKKPHYGYGSCMNPCIDCRILILNKAKQYMNKFGARFVITGEVLGQRPMSQNSQAIQLIESKSGVKGYIVRPLSVQAAEESIPEQKGWINRNKLLKISGRSRKKQISLADSYGFKSYSQPAGGCLLTEKAFGKKLQESIKHGEGGIRNIELLTIGRHFRLFTDKKAIVGRNQDENDILVKYADKTDLLFEPVSVPGPTVLLKNCNKKSKDKYIPAAAFLCAKYSNKKDNIVVQYGNKSKKEIKWINKLVICIPEDNKSLEDQKGIENI